MKSYWVASKVSLSLLIGVIALASGRLASADVALTAAVGNGTLQVTGPFTGDYIYSYTAQLTGGETFTSGFTDEYCITDINGLIGGSASIPATSGYTLTQGLGAANISSGVGSENSVNFVEVAYTGAPTIATGSSLPEITFYSTSGLNGGVDIGYGGAAAGSNSLQSFNQAQLVGPVSTPEPASLSLLAVGAGALMLRRRRR